MQDIIQILQEHSELLEEFPIKSLSVFGSYARGEANPDSDVDILVEFHPDACVGYFAFARLQKKLSDIIQKPVDLVAPDALHKAMKKQILEDAVHAV